MHFLILQAICDEMTGLGYEVIGAIKSKIVNQQAPTRYAVSACSLSLRPKRANAITKAPANSYRYAEASYVRKIQNPKFKIE